MSVEHRFSTELDRVDELPPPLAEAVGGQLHAREVVGLLIFKPAEQAGVSSSPPKALAVTDRGLIFAEAPDDGRPVRAERCPFDAVLLVELATLLLYGHLRVDYVGPAGARHLIGMEYNGVADALYRRAATLILEAIAPGRAAPAPAAEPPTADWPEPIRRAVAFGKLSDAPAYAAACWPSVRGGFGFDLAPAGAVLARADWLSVVTLEQSGPWDRIRLEPTFGTIVTYVPASRIAAVASHPSPRLAVLELQVHARHGGEPFPLAVPVDNEAAVRAVIDAVVARCNPA